MSKGVEELKQELQECRDEVPRMVELGQKIDDILSKKMATGDVLERLKEQGTQLKKDIENYKHMLEEADDLRKSWEKDETKMANINQNRRFNEAANMFELPIDDLVNMNEKQIAPAKPVNDRVKFTRYDAGGGEIKDLPIVFEFGLLNKHNMGGWEQAGEDEVKDDNFSFTFRWDEENYDDRDVMDELRIKATSIVVLIDDETSTIVNFDVEPGFEHQWGYGRQRFLKQSTLRANSNKVRAQAIIKEWSEQHEYELGKYAIDLLRQSKANRAQISRHVNFIVDQAQQSTEWSTEKMTMEQEITRLKSEITVITLSRDEIKTEVTTKEATIEELRVQLAEKTTEVETQKTFISSLEVELQEARLNQVVQEQQSSGAVPDYGDGGDTGSAQVGRDPKAVIAKLEGELAEKSEENAKLLSEIEELKRQLAEKEAEVEELKKKAEEALETIKQLNDDKNVLQAKIDELEANINKLAELVKNQGKENEDLKAELEHKKEECKAELDDANAAADKLRDELAGKDKEVDAEKEKNAVLTTTVTELEASITTYKKRVQIIAKKHNGCRDRLIKAKEDIDMSRENARKAIELLKPIAGLAEVEIPDAIDIDETVIVTEEEMSKTVIVEKTTTTSGADTGGANVEIVSPEKEKVIEAVNANDGAESSSSSSSDEEEKVVDETPLTGGNVSEAPNDEQIVADKVSSSSSSSSNDSDVEPATPNNVEGVGDEEDLIIADKVTPEGRDSPKFFPPKEEPVQQSAKPEEDKISVGSVSSTTGKQRKGSKSLAKFDLKMGVKKDKGEKKSGFSKFISMCTRGTSSKDKKQTIESNDPQRNPPASPS